MNNIRKYLKIDELQRNGLTGENITIAILDTGVINHRDLRGRILCFKDCVEGRMQLYDDNGHGTHIAGILAGNGFVSNGKYTGIAPKANVVVVKVLDKRGMGKEDTVVNGIRWIIDNRIKYNIKIVNISFGTINSQNIEQSKMMQAVELLWDVGITVVVAAGNNGPNRGTITAPGSSKKVITVGALEDNRRVNINGKYIANYSGRGPTHECIQKPELIAPANEIISCNNSMIENMRAAYTSKSGTSMAAPIVAGIIALYIQKNICATNIEIKRNLRKTCIDRNIPIDKQGWGLINPSGLIYFKNKV